MKTASSQSGNVFFIIMIAISLFAALSYAVAIGGRSYSKDVSDEALNLAATEFIQYAEGMATAVTQMRLRGVTNTNLCFDEAKYAHALYNFGACSTASNKVYDPTGGNVIWAQPDAKWFTASATRFWDIGGNYEISGIGTTCAAASCSDLVLHIDSITRDLCIRINQRLGVTNPSDAPPLVASGVAWAQFAGTYTADGTVSDASGSLLNKNAACFVTSSNKHKFYRVLEAR